MSEEPSTRPAVAHTAWARANFFDSLAELSRLLHGELCWVLLGDGLVEIRLIGSWHVTSRGSLDLSGLATRADLSRSDFGKDGVLVLGCLGKICLQRVEGSKATLDIVDGYLLEQRIPSEHESNRPNIRVRRG